MFKQIRLGLGDVASPSQRRCTSCVKRNRIYSALDIVLSVHRAQRRANNKGRAVRRLRRQVAWSREQAFVNELEGWRQSQRSPEEQYRSIVFINMSDVELSVRVFEDNNEERYFELQPHGECWLMAQPSQMLICRGMDGREGTLNGWRVLPVCLVVEPYVVEAAAPPPLAGVPSLAELCAAQLVRTGTAAQARALPLPQAAREELALRIGVPLSHTDPYMGADK